jgi:anti-sigma regulatory factor (Ser/Thr protein kinase)
MQQQSSRTGHAMAADVRTKGDYPVNETMTAYGVDAPHFRLALRIPHDPDAADHRWPGRWPYLSGLEMPALDTAPGCARAHVRALLREWKADNAVAEDALLVLSELMTNAVATTHRQATPAPVRLWMLGDGVSVLVLVWDATMPPPVPAPAAADAEHGRGLAIVAALSARWGWYFPAEQPGGKVVWALLQTAGPPDRRPALTSRTAHPHPQRRAVEKGTPGLITRRVPVRRVPPGPAERRVVPALARPRGQEAARRREGPNSAPHWRRARDRKEQPVSHATAPGDREDAAVRAACPGRRQCICQEDPGNGPCECALPVTREQVGRLRAYASQHPERAFIMSELAGEWMSALVDFLPPGTDGEDPVLAWMSAPCTLPPAADLRASADLEALLDMLDAPPAAALS